MPGTAAVSQIEPIPTGVESLDRILGGGIPRGSIILLAGHPGSGKTTIAAKILYEAARRYGESTAYISFVQTRQDFIAQMKSVGMDFRELEEKNLFYYIEAVTMLDEETLSQQVEGFLRMVIEKGITRVVVDSITAVLHIVNNPVRVREFIQNLFVNGLKPLGVISIMISEHPYGVQVIGYGVEEFMVDAVIILKTSIERGRLKRLIEVRKVRWAPITIAEAVFSIDPSTILTIHLSQSPQTLPVPSKLRTIEIRSGLDQLTKSGILLLRSSRECQATTGDNERVEDEATRYIVEKYVAEIPVGYQILVTLKESVEGFARLVSQLLATLVLLAPGEHRVGIVSFHTSPEVIRHNIGVILKGAGVDAGDVASKYLSRLYIYSVNPSSYIFEELLWRIRRFIEDNNISIIVFENTRILSDVHGIKRVLRNFYDFMLYMKGREITAVYTILNPRTICVECLSSVADIHLSLRSHQPVTISVMGGGRSLIQPVEAWLKTAYGQAGFCLWLNVDVLDRIGFFP